MRALAVGELNAWLNEEPRELMIHVRRPGETSWTDMSSVLGGDWQLAVDTDMHTPDTPVSRFVCTFLKHATEGSAAPGIQASPLNTVGTAPNEEYKPLLHPGVEIVVYVRASPHPWRQWLHGDVEDSEWHGDSVRTTCMTWDGVVQAAQIDTETDAPGGAVETVIQWYLDTYLPALPDPLVTEGTPGWTVPAQKTELGSLGDRLRGYAQENGWDLRFKWNEAASGYRYTLYEPPRGNTAVDLSVSAERTLAAASLKQSRAGIRNVIHVDYFDKDTDAWERVTVQDADSVTKYRKQPMVLGESLGSPIDSNARATALANMALHDLGKMLTDGRYEIPFLPWLELHDLLDIAPDADNHDFTVSYALIGGSHRVAPDSWSTTVDLHAGGPVGSFYGWRRRKGAMEDATRILSADVEKITNGNCSLSAALVNRITVSFAKELPGDTWTISRYEEGTNAGVIASGLPLSQTTFEDEINAEFDVSGASYMISYRVAVESGDIRYTQDLHQPRIACP